MIRELVAGLVTALARLGDRTVMAFPEPHGGGRRVSRCECDARDAGAVAYHGGREDGCHREAADHMNGWPGGVFASPALCMACLFGCAE